MPEVEIPTLPPGANQPTFDGMQVDYMLGYLDELTNSIIIDDVLLILASVVGVGMLFFLGWLGVRKATRTFTTAVSTGKIKI